MARGVRAIDSTEPAGSAERRSAIARPAGDSLGAVAGRATTSADSALLGESAPMCRLKHAIVRLAPIPSPVLVIGESGCGKELVARDLHRLSARAGEPFLAVNCAALSESLAESELFGHERGAFTGAFAMRRGLFETAAGGTIFLDEIGELPLSAQGKLLRVLEERVIVRVGAARPVSVAARVVAATHRNLEEDVTRGRFRHDLLYRINVHTLAVPPLRERLTDVPELVDHFVALCCARFGVPEKGIAPSAIEVLARHDWKRNNVRELRNVVERMIIQCDEEIIGVEHVPHDIAGCRVQTNGEERRGTFADLKAASERQIIVDALDRNAWHITRTAQELGLADHASLLKIMRRLGLRSALRSRSD
jgi:DNA-binding NtrC family response regulator